MLEAVLQGQAPGRYWRVIMDGTQLYSFRESGGSIQLDHGRRAK